MDAQTHFTAFLQTTVNLKPWKLTQLDGRVASIVAAVQDDVLLGPMFKEHIPQGSWAHRTIIEPVSATDEFDADFLLHLQQDEDWSKEPQEYLRQARAAFKRHSTYAGMVEKKNRCVRIVYANDCHVDVVPHLTLADGRQVIINYKENDFEDTNPAGFTAWMKERDDLANGNLRVAIRLLKYLRDFKNTFSCPSVILTTLIGGRVQPWDNEARYADIPTTLVHLLEDLDTWLGLYPEMPLLDDPSCPGTSFNHRWNEEQYLNFAVMIGKYAGWARAAYDADDDEEALKWWQKLFGPEFVAPEVQAVVKSIAASQMPRPVALREAAAPHEEFIELRGYRFTPRYRATLECRVHGMRGFRSPRLRELPSVPKGVKLRFKVLTDAPPGFTVLWKVRNRGQAATAARDLRGEIRPDGVTHEESTLYPGRHYVEVYLVRDGQVIASDHHDVVIR
jgi:Second Messenger Oligonucleotide or Dinucleotide Synthetase domain/Adenylyl/Guanylyl and SMODS C-terminal sensor domain